MWNARVGGKRGNDSSTHSIFSKTRGYPSPPLYFEYSYRLKISRFKKADQAGQAGRKQEDPHGKKDEVISVVIQQFI
jgi:hypothetical protein